MKDERWLRVGVFLDADRRALGLKIARIGGDLFRGTPETPLPPGEYVLSLNELGAPVYDFAVKRP